MPAKKFRLSADDSRKAMYAAATAAKRYGTAVAMRHLKFGAAKYHQSPQD
jgi:hypothetical protein